MFFPIFFLNLLKCYFTVVSKPLPLIVTCTGIQHRLPYNFSSIDSATIPVFFCFPVAIVWIQCLFAFPWCANPVIFLSAPSCLWSRLTWSVLLHSMWKKIIHLSRVRVRVYDQFLLVTINSFWGKMTLWDKFTLKVIVGVYLVWGCNYHWLFIVSVLPAVAVEDP